MSVTKLANIFALSTLAVLLCSFAPSQTLALTVRADHLARQLPNHHGIARKKRSKRDGTCKPRSSTSPPASTPAYQPTSTPQSSPSPNNSPSPSSTQSPSTVPTSTPGSGKLGIAWALGNDQRLLKITAPGHVNYIFLWDSAVPDLVRQSGLPISVMCWDDSDAKVSAFKQNVVQGYANQIRGPNEVNEPSQANMSVDRGISLWRNVIAPYKAQGFELAGPVTTSAPNGFDWVTQYLNECPDCRPDIIPLHYYDVKFEDLKAYVEKWETFGYDMSVTEFACQDFNGNAQPSMDQIWSFTTQAVDYFKSNPKIRSYAPFGFMDDLYNVNPADGLFNGDGLSDLGSYYANN